MVKRTITLPISSDKTFLSSFFSGVDITLYLAMQGFHKTSLLWNLLVVPVLHGVGVGVEKGGGGGWCWNVRIW